MNTNQPIIKQRVYEILESSNPNDFLSNLDDWGVTLLVILDVSSFILSTSKTSAFALNTFLIDIEWVAVVCFTILYILQLWSCTVERRKELESQEFLEITSSLSQQPLTPEQQQRMSAHVERRAELMNMCIDAAKGKFGDRFEDEAIIRDFAISLYTETVRKFNL